MQNTYQEKIDDLEVTNSGEKRKLEGGIKFKIKSEFQPNGDQPEAIKKLLKNLKENKQEQVLLGVTGSGKTFTMAKVIEQANRPALILAPNKTLATNFTESLKVFFQITRLNILCLTMIITHLKHTCQDQILILKRKLPLTSKLIG